MTAHAISWAPYLPWSVIGLLGLVAFALCIWAFYRQAGGTALRGLTFAILLLILANPSLVIEERDPISDIVVVISDRSQSQSIADRPEQTDQATAHILAELKALENTDTHLIEVKTGSLQEEADGTRLFTALRGRLRSLPRVLALITRREIGEQPAPGCHVGRCLALSRGDGATRIAPSLGIHRGLKTDPQLYGVDRCSRK